MPQPVGNAEISKPAAESAEVSVCDKCINVVTAEPVTHRGGVKMVEACDLDMWGGSTLIY